MRLRWVIALLLFTSVAFADKVEELNSALLNDPSYKVKVQAALVLGKLGDRRAVGALIQALRDENELVRAIASLSLGKLGDPSATDPLRAIAGDASPMVRSNVERALAMLAAPGSPIAKSARHFVTTKIVVSGGGLDAPHLLAEATAAELGRLPQVITSSGALPTGAALRSRKMSGWIVEGKLQMRMIGGGGEAGLDCDLNASIATFPAHSIRAMSRVGASVPGVRSASDGAAQRQCFEAIAQGLAEDFGKFLSKQP